MKKGKTTQEVKNRSPHSFKEREEENDLFIISKQVGGLPSGLPYNQRYITIRVTFRVSIRVTIRVTLRVTIRVTLRATVRKPSGLTSE